jgi:hypothetical protein
MEKEKKGEVGKMTNYGKPVRGLCPGDCNALYLGRPEKPFCNLHRCDLNSVGGKILANIDCVKRNSYIEKLVEMMGAPMLFSQSDIIEAGKAYGIDERVVKNAMAKMVGR